MLAQSSRGSAAVRVPHKVIDAVSQQNEARMPKRRVFISFDHDDTAQVNGFLGLRNIMDNLEFYNHKLDREIQGQSDEYKRRRIREKYIRPASVTIVLIGNRTAFSKWVGWEIEDSVAEGNGLLGIRLQGTDGPIPAGLPANNVGGWDPEKFLSWIEWAAQNR